MTTEADVQFWWGREVAAYGLALLTRVGSLSHANDSEHAPRGGRTPRGVASLQDHCHHHEMGNLFLAAATLAIVAYAAYEMFKPLWS